MSKKSKNKNKHQPSTPQRREPISTADVKSFFSPVKATVESAPAISSLDGTSPEIKVPKDSILDKIKKIIPLENKLSDEEKETLNALQKELNDLIDLYKIAKEDCDNAKTDYDSKIAELGKTAKEQEAKDGELKGREDKVKEREDEVTERERKAKENENGGFLSLTQSVSLFNLHTNIL